MTKTELESDDFFLSIIPLPLHIKEHNFLIIGLPVAPKLWNGLFPSKKDKMVDAQPEGIACSTRVISGRLAKRFGSRFGTNTELLRRVIRPISTPNDRRNTVFYEVISLSGSSRTKALPRSHGKTSTCCNSLPVCKRSFVTRKEYPECRSPPQIETYSLG